MIVAGEWLREPRAIASDRERELVVDVLRDASARGQLSVTEFDQRWEYLQVARTVGDLLPLVSDLPNVPPPAERPVGRRRRMVEPPADPVALRTPENALAPPAHPDPLETSGAVMLPFEDHSWAEPAPAAPPGQDGSGRRRAAADAPFGPDARSAEEAPMVARPEPEAPPAPDRHQERERARSAPAASTQASAAEEWNTSLRACIGSFVLLIAGLLLAVVLG